MKSPKNGGGDGAQNLDEELRGIASADQNAISIIEKNIDSDHEICQCKCMKKFDAYMEARNATNMFVYNWNSIVRNAINKCQSHNGWNINEFLFISLRGPVILSD